MTARTAAEVLEADVALRAMRAEARARMTTDAAHDEAHLLRVADWTLRLAPDAYREAGEMPPQGLERLAVASAMLHDVVNLPKSDPRRADASRLSAEVARAILSPLGFGPDDLALVADAILDHSYSRGVTPRSPLGRAMQDADRLEALGALGVLRCVATGTSGGAALFDPDDPWAERRPFDERRFALDHFQTKLLRLPSTLCTAAGRAEAARRVALMVRLLQALGDEIGVPYRGIGDAHSG
jgi:uncharacterized protein